MNYIDLINNAWSLREQGIISICEQDLYMYLVHKCNMLFWKNPFNQPTEVLCSILNTNRNALTARRNRLKQLGLIDFKEGRAKNHPAEYTILCGTSNREQDAKAVKSTETAVRTEAAKEKRNFLPPTLPEVQAYCTERGNKVDARQFIDFYTAKGWMLGKNKMKDWKAAVRTWERNSTRIEHPSTRYKQQNTMTDERF